MPKLTRATRVIVACSAMLSLAACGSSGSTPASPASAKPSATAAKPAAATTPVTFLMDYLPSGYQAPFYYGVAKGFYRAAGLDVTIIGGHGSGHTVQEVGNSKYDVGFADTTTAAIAISKGVPIRVIASYFQKNPFGLLFENSSHLTTPASLEGKKLAVNLGGASPKLLHAFLAINHIPAAKVHLVGMSGNSLIPSVLAGKTAASVGIVALSVPQAAARGYKVSGMLFADWGLSNLSSGLVVNKTYLKSHTALLKKFVAATDRAWKAAMSDPTAAVAAETKAVGKTKMPPASVATLKEVFPLLHTANSKGHPLGWMAPKDWANTRTILKRYFNVKLLPAADYYTDSLFAK